jgi:hypothetical protein
MIVEPSHQSPRPVALLTAGWRSCRIQTATEDRLLYGPERVHKGIAELEGHVVYARGLLHCLHATGATRWQATTWKGRAVSLTLDGTKVTVLSLRDSLGDGPADQQLTALLTVCDWLASHGVRMGSLSSMAWRLWCSTLTVPLSIASLPQIGHAAFYGPRQEVRDPKRYQHMAVVDLSSAYPTAMAERPIALTLKEVSCGTNLDPDQPGLARATLRVPEDLQFGPLPSRVADGVIQWRHGRVTGFWPWAELVHAQSLGCDIESVERNFAPALEAQPFTRWHALVEEGRHLPHPASLLVKCIANALWGMFAMAGDHTATVRWSDESGEDPIVVARSRRALPQASTAHVAAEVAARVRVRTLAEVYKVGAEGFPVHVDTDGMIVRRSIANHYPKVAGPGQWRRKQTMRTVEIRAPQLYRYQCNGPCCTDRWHDGHFDSTTAQAVHDDPARDRDRWHYVAAGMSPTTARELFERVEAPSRCAVLDHETVLPPAHAWEVAKLEPWLAEARGLRMAMFGPGLDR